MNVRCWFGCDRCWGGCCFERACTGACCQSVVKSGVCCVVVSWRIVCGFQEVSAWALGRWWGRGVRGGKGVHSFRILLGRWSCRQAGRCRVGCMRSLCCSCAHASLLLHVVNGRALSAPHRGRCCAAAAAAAAFGVGVCLNCEAGILDVCLCGARPPPVLLHTAQLSADPVTLSTPTPRQSLSSQLSTPQWMTAEARG